MVKIKVNVKRKMKQRLKMYFSSNCVYYGFLRFLSRVWKYMLCPSRNVAQNYTDVKSKKCAIQKNQTKQVSSKSFFNFDHLNISNIIINIDIIINFLWFVNCTNIICAFPSPPHPSCKNEVCAECIFFVSSLEKTLTLTIPLCDKPV